MNRRIHYILWSFFIIFILIVSYASRFWICNDTIGSLDSAKAFKNIDFANAVNAYWGIGYAFLLSFLPLNGLQSWLNIHLLIALILLLSLLCIYKLLISINIDKVIATSLCLIWGLANFTTGSAFYLTADVLLCLLGSIYLLAVRRYNNNGSSSSAVILGSIHGIAWWTKNIALVGLLIFPIYIIFTGIYQGFKEGISKKKLIGVISFVISYSLPFVLLISLWGAGCLIKYNRFTMGDTGSYALGYYQKDLRVLHKSIETSRHSLPRWGTYWWSDISSSLSGWNFHANLDVKARLERANENLQGYLQNPFKPGTILILIIILGALNTISRGLKTNWQLNYLEVLPLVSIFVISLYLATCFEQRYFPFAALFSLPGCATFIQGIVDKKNKNTMAMYCLLFVIFSGEIILTAYTAFYLSPGSEHFQIAEKIKADTGIKTKGPIGAFIPPFNWFHHGMIAFLLDTKAAEITPVTGESQKFVATFQPQVVLLVLPTAIDYNNKIVVNSHNYTLLGLWTWRKGGRQRQFVVYKPSIPSADQ